MSLKKRISQLAAGSGLDETGLIPITMAGATKKYPVQDVLDLVAPGGSGLSFIVVGCENDPVTTGGLNYGYKAGVVHAVDIFSFISAGVLTIDDGNEFQIYSDGSGDPLQFAPIAPPGSFVVASVETSGGEFVAISQAGPIADASKFAYGTNGIADTIQGAAATGDDGTNPARAQGGNASAEAVGANQIGARLYLVGGIGTRQIEIVDWEDASIAGCIVGFIIDGGGSDDLTEGVAWTAETSNEVSAQNLATAINFFIGASVATVVGAVVEITPIVTWLSFSLSTDADPTGMTVLNAPDGVVNLSSPRAVANLPPAADVGAGARAFVNDALVPVFGSNVADGGAANVPVYSDGTNWVVG